MNLLGNTPEKSTAFRLTNELLEAVDDVCRLEDLTRSQFFRRSAVDYLRKLHREREQDERTSA